MRSDVLWIPLVTTVLGGVAACREAPIEQSAAALTAVCVADRGELDEASWICGESRVLECDTREEASAVEIYVPATEHPELSCEEASLVVDPGGPLPVGDHVVTVSLEAGTSTLCASEVRVVDTTPPTATPKATNLWPPNHKLHRIGIEDCVEVEDRCDRDTSVVFTHAASNEPAEGQGDGNTAEDIVGLGCDQVQLRAERQGGSTGRVYTLGFRATDGSGNSTEGTCTVIVAHDQSEKRTPGAAEVYRVEAPSTCAAPEPPSNGGL